MTSKTHDRQLRSGQARRAAARTARIRAARRRKVFVAGGVLLLVLVVVAAARSGGKGSDVKASATTTTSAATTGSVAGKPCVAVSGAVPAGSPEVPVKPGPPPTKLVTEDLRVGDGVAVEPGATVTVNYTGVSCSTGKVFDSSYGKQPVAFPLDNVIKGWGIGIPGMKVGGLRLLGIPSAQAYGSQGKPPTIAADETLWFVVEVLDTKPS